jgi:hypothetical protein
MSQNPRRGQSREGRLGIVPLMIPVRIVVIKNLACYDFSPCLTHSLPFGVI